MMRLVFRILFFVFLTASFLFGGNGGDKKNKVLTNDDYKYIAVNQIKMWISNNGDGSHDPQTDGNGLYWPGGINATKGAVFEDGLLFAGIINGETRANGNTHRQGLQAGKIINGVPDDPGLLKYRIYKVLRGWQNLPPGLERDAYETDHNQWPWEDGAPFIDNDNNGVYNPAVDEPEYVGDEMLWYVANDMDPLRSTFTYGTQPMGIEFQTSVFAFKESKYADMVYKRYLMINKGTNTVDSMYVAYWSDVDLGEAVDDYTGVDTSLKLLYVYNGDNADGVYGIPPAIGYGYLQRPVVPGTVNDSARFMNRWVKGYRNLNIASHVMYLGSAAFPFRDPQQGVPQGAIELYNYMKGLIWNGNTIFDPHTNQPTTFMVPGDPVNQTGWYEGAGWPSGPFQGDRRGLISAGPFTFAPGDTQEVIFGIVLGQGTSNINSISVMKEKAKDLQRLYYYNFTPTLVDVNEDPLQEITFTLQQNYPNPFNPETNIKYYIPDEGQVKISVFNIMGEEVALLLNEYMSPGVYEIKFNASGLPSGTYFYRLSMGSQSIIKKMMLIK
jgi:hypothetical protein